MLVYAYGRVVVVVGEWGGGKGWDSCGGGGGGGGWLWWVWTSGEKGRCVCMCDGGCDMVGW